MRVSCLDLLGAEVSTYRCPYRARGVVVGETYNTFLVLTKNKVITIPKSICYFYVYDLNVLVNGIYLVGYRDKRLFGCGFKIS
ncbi:MAG: ribonuclease P protein subunit [Pyrobaculum sp.]|nr:ribonuclease P protein subunit [Pyrobaculum sp.]